MRDRIATSHRHDLWRVAAHGGQDQATGAMATLVVEALAVYRATKLLQQDDLPPLPVIREKLMARWGASPWSALLDCPWCLSVWVGGASVALRHLAPRFWRVGASVLASSAVAGVISEWVAGKELPEVAADAVASMERATETINEAAETLSQRQGDGVVVQHHVASGWDRWPGTPSGAETEAARMRDRLPDA